MHKAMRHNAKLDALVTRNIADLEAAFSHARDVIDKRLLKILHSIVRQMIDPAEWYIQFDGDDFELWMAPRRWLVPDSRPTKARARFEFDELFEEDADEAETWLSALTAASSGVPKTALYFQQEPLGKLAWKRLVRSNDAARDLILAQGFNYSLTEGDFYFPVTVDQEALAGGFENGRPEEAFEQLRNAVAAMIASATLFEGLGVQLSGTGVSGVGGADDRDE